MSELLIEGCPVVGECMAHHPLHPLPCCSIQDPVGTVPGKIEYFFLEMLRPYSVDVIVEEVLKRKNAVEGVEAQVVVELAVFP